MIRILTTLYNSDKYIHNTILSLKHQTTSNFKCYITDDISTDRSIEVVNNLIKNDKRFELLINKKKMYQPGNYWKVLKRKEIKDEDICITLDGDDWLSDSKVLERVESYYKDPNIWMTFGQFVQFLGKNSFTSGFTCKPSDWSRIRDLSWTSSHLRTFKAFLFRKILKEDLISPNGNFWEVTGDLAICLPMMEMAGESRVKYVSDINMVYNVENTLNDFKVNNSKQQQYASLIRKKTKYEVL